MGKAALLLVLATSIVVTYGLANRIETSQQTARHQAGFEETVIAREIARSGFNVAMGILRQHGDDLQAGVLAVNGPNGYLEGEHQGGIYRVTATYVTGHSVEVVSTGYFGGRFNAMGQYEGGVRFTMDDSYTYRVTTTPLLVKQCSMLDVRFLQSDAGFCSAVYLQRILPDVAPEDQPPPEMLFAPGRRRNGAALAGRVEKILSGGTQMNFFIAVSQNCNAYGRPWGGNQWETYDVQNHVFDPRNYNHIHYAFEKAALEMNEVEESIWAMVEQHPANNQRWRIAWEDQHIRNWDRPNSNNPANSLQATKRLGYDGNGWPDRDQWGYRLLRDYGNRPDFSDQVIDIQMTPLPISRCEGGLAAGGEVVDDPIDDPGLEVLPPPDAGGNLAADQYSLPNFAQQGCPCPGNGPRNHKVLLMHRPPGNPGNEQRICVARPAAMMMLQRFDNYIICEGR